MDSIINMIVVLVVIGLLVSMIVIAVSELEDYENVEKIKVSEPQSTLEEEWR